MDSSEKLDHIKLNIIYKVIIQVMLITKKDILKIDSEKMHEVYDNWPKIAMKSYKKNYEIPEFKNIDHIIFAGMGGSGTIGDIFSSILSKTNIHVEVIKGYLLPKTVDSKSLVVTTSISGNTEETLSVLSKVLELKCKSISFSDNGKMKNYCEKNRLNHRNIRMNHSPRASFPTFLFSILRVLEPFLPIEKRDIHDSLDKLQKQKERISSLNLNDTNPAISIAKWMPEVPLIYYPSGLQAAAIRLKNSLQENTKMHTFNEDIIEVCHNGIVAWEHTSSVQPIIIQGADDHIKTKERCSLLEEYFKKNSIQFYKISSIKGSILSKLITLIFLLDYVTIYLAVLQNIDPTPVKSIDFIKKRLKEIS